MTKSSKSQSPPTSTKEEAAKIKRDEKIKKDNDALKSKRAKTLAEREYVPKTGTGKMFHIELENPAHNKAGKKVSVPSVQIMEVTTFIQWVFQAARLGFAFAAKHDPSIFHPDQKAKIKEALSDYVGKISMDTFEYGMVKLANTDNSINVMLLKAYRNRSKEIKESIKEKVVKKSFID